MRWLRINLFAALLVVCATPWASPPIALALGPVLGAKDEEMSVALGTSAPDRGRKD